MSTIARQTEQTKGKLLVIDDDLVQRTIIGKIGTKLGYDTATASTFELASGLLRSDVFDIMTLDLSLGEHDGVELLRLIAELKLNAMPIVIISGCDDRILNTTRRIGQSLDLSITCCLTKPLNLDDVRNALLAPVAGQSADPYKSKMLTIDRDRILLALDRNEFCVEFQPKIDLQSGQAIGAEALARWCLPEFGMLSPAVFIPLVEEVGLMSELTNRILTVAVRDGRGLIDRHPGFTIAVNVSGSLLSDLTLPEQIESILRREGVAPESLIVEVTESVAMSDVQRAMDIIVRLRIKGLGAAIDDFGTGFSSLSALSRFPFSELKIDQSFVKDCDRDEDMMKIVEASIALARAFGMKVVAEGIDSLQTLRKLQLAGCDIGQGYFFSSALGLERAESWVESRNTQDTTRLPRVGIH